jgi:Rrf2 family protein
MKLITKETDYAIRAILNLARRPGEFASSRDIAGSEEIPLQFLRRILQTLIKHDIVESREGAAGGVRLVAKPAKLRLIDVMEVFQGKLQLSDCMFRKRLCSNAKTCVLRKRIKRIEQVVAREFNSVTIADLLRDLEAQA